VAYTARYLGHYMVLEPGDLIKRARLREWLMATRSGGTCATAMSWRWRLMASGTIVR
jgi:hypothetical protein